MRLQGRGTLREGGGVRLRSRLCQRHLHRRAMHERFLARSRHDQHVAIGLGQRRGG